MPNYQIKTRNDSSPQGKPMVYFCAHPADKVHYWDMIADEILDLYNVAVFCSTFEGEPPSQSDEHFSNLSEAQLFVFPVTASLLSEDSFAMTEIDFARQKHIPILPLMQEKGLAKDFTNTFGNIQFLYNNVEDQSALSYESKLKAFLDSVLFGDALLQKIRAAFDAYVFLSYRKTDRKYAKELMRLIHGNDLCRDIALWYDEYLVPGENFDEAIEEMLKKSDMFALVVTPNLIQENNYVMRVEYPLAMQQEKPIISVEFEETDRSLLLARYDNIDPLSPLAETVGNRFAEQLRALAIRENDSSPEHCFFIGLAYLGGIDVEVDCDRALSLITYAAQNGILEATRKLVLMYQNGDGVEQSIDQSIAWQEKLVAQLLAQTKADTSIALKCELIDERNRLKNMKEERDWHPCESAYDILADATAWLADSDEPCAIRTLGDAYVSVFLDADFIRPDPAYLQGAIACAERYAAIEHGIEGQLYLAKTYYFASMDTDGKAYLDRARDILEPMRQKGNAPSDALSLLADVYCGQSSCFCEQGEYETAFTYAMLALDSAKLCGDALIFGYTCRSIAELYADVDRYDEAQCVLTSGITYFVQLCRKEQNRFFVQMLARLYKEISALCDRFGDGAAAFKYATLALDRYASLAHEYPFGDYIKNAEEYARDTADLFFDETQYTNAIYFYEQELCLHAALIAHKRFKHYPFHAALRIAQAHLALGDLAMAEKSLARLQEALQNEPNLFYCSEQSDTLGRLLCQKHLHEDAAIAFLIAAGGFLHCTGAQGNARNALLQAADAWFDAQKAGKAKACYMLAQKVPDTEPAEQHRLQSLAQRPAYRALLSRLEKELKNRQNDKDGSVKQAALCALLYMTGCTCEAVNAKDKALAYYKESFALVQAYLSPHDMAEKSLTLAEIARRCAGDPAAIDCLQDAEQIIAPLYLAEQAKAADQVRSTYMSSAQLLVYSLDYCRILQTRGDILRSTSPKQALEAYEKAQSIAHSGDNNPYELHELWLHLGECSVVCGEYEKAMAAFALAKAYIPGGRGNAALWGTLTRCYFAMGELAEGNAAYDTYKKLVQKQLGKCLWRDNTFKDEQRLHTYGQHLADWSEICSSRVARTAMVDQDFITACWVYFLHYYKRMDKQGVRLAYAQYAHTLTLLMQAQPLENCYNLLCTMLGCEAECAMQENDPDALRDCLTKLIRHLTCYSAHVSQNPEHDCNLLALCYYNLATSFGEPFDTALLQKAHDLWSHLASEHPDQGYEYKRDAVAKLLKD